MAGEKDWGGFGSFYDSNGKIVDMIAAAEFIVRHDPVSDEEGKYLAYEIADGTLHPGELDAASIASFDEFLSKIVTIEQVEG